MPDLSQFSYYVIRVLLSWLIRPDVSLIDNVVVSRDAAGISCHINNFQI